MSVGNVDRIHYAALLGRSIHPQDNFYKYHDTKNVSFVTCVKWCVLIPEI